MAVTIGGAGFAGGSEPAPSLPDALKGYKFFKEHFAGGKLPEFVEMLWAIDKEEMGPGTGWFKVGQSRYDWKWLANKYDVDRDGHIIPLEFTGPVEIFATLDLDKSKVLTSRDVSGTEPDEKKLEDAGSQFIGKVVGSLVKMPAKEKLVAGLINGEIGSIFEGPKLDHEAPDFVLATEDNKRQVRLSEYKGKRPVVLIFGSFT